MKGLYGRLVGAYAILLAMLLIGLGIVLGQFFPFFYKSLEAPTSTTYTIYLIVTLVIAFILSMLIAMRMLLNYAKPIDDITVVASKIAEGEAVDWTHHPRLHYYEDDLAYAIKEIAGNIEEISAKRGIEKDRLKTLIESMGSGLLMFGRGGTVRLVNGMFRKTFGYENVEIIGQTISEVGLPMKLRN